VGSALRLHAPQICGKIGDSRVEIGMRAFACEQAVNFCSNRLNWVHAPYHLNYARTTLLRRLSLALCGGCVILRFD